jgi:hypothetical protein
MHISLMRAHTTWHNTAVYEVMQYSILGNCKDGGLFPLDMTLLDS